MKIKTIEIQGFLSIGNIPALILDRKGLTLIEGLNHDSSADSNGAGKSSVFEALHWCLFGSTRRGLTGDEVMNRHVKGGTMVQVEIESMGTPYSIRRARKSKEHKTGLWLCKTAGEELTKGTIKATQELIEEIMGCNMLTFQKTVFFGQGDVRPIAELTDAELKSVFDQGLGLSQLPIDAQKVAGYRKGLESSMAASIAELKSQKTMSDLTAVALEESKKAVEGFMTAKEGRLKELAHQHTDASGTYSEAKGQSKLRTEAIAKLTEEMAVIQGRVHEMGEMRSKFDDKMEGVSGRLARAAALLPRLDSESISLSDSMKRAAEKIGSDCESCGQIMDSESTNKFVAVMFRKHERVKSSIDDEQNRKKEAQEEREKMEAILKPFQIRIDELQAQWGDLSLKTANLSRERAVSENISMMKSVEMERLKGEIAKTEADDGKSLTESVLRAEMSIASFSENIGKLEDDILTASSRLDIAKLLEEALGNAGLKGLVFDRATPSLNTYANDALSILDPGMSVEISTVSILKSGEKREKFSVSVETAKGAAVFGGHSGGEKQKVNLAVSLAFNTLMRASSVNAPNLLILDEPFESLDQGSSDQVMELLAGLEVDNVFLITHNQSVKDLIPSRILVEKRDGVSFIS